MNPAMACTAIIIRHARAIVPILGGDEDHVRFRGHPVNANGIASLT